MYTVVVADDETRQRDAMIETVPWKELGFEVVGAAENGIEALELVELYEPDLLLTDIRMPFLSGIDLARRAREIRPAMNIVFLSGYDDFSYAQQAIQYNIISYLLKPISAKEITENLRDIKEKMDKQIHVLLSGESKEDLVEKKKEYERSAVVLSLTIDSPRTVNLRDSYWEEMKEQVIRLGIQKSEVTRTNYQIMVVRFLDEEEINCTNQTNMSLINGILSKYLPFGTAFSNGKIISLLSGNKRDLDKYAPILSKEIIQVVKKVLDRKCLLGISRSYECLKELNGAYSEALEACIYANVDLEVPVFIADIETPSSYSAEEMSGVTSELDRLIKVGTEEELALFLNDLLGGRGSKVHNFTILQVVSTIYAVYCNAVDEKEAEKRMEELNFPGQVYIHMSTNSVKKEILEFAMEAKKGVQNQRKDTVQVLCDDTIEIINTEYMKEELSLAGTSERLHVSAGYLSTIVKKVKGESFVILLTKKRMDVAKNLLECSSKKILEIANDCGYSDQHYFSYCFKKNYGMSPNKYRDSVKNKS